MKTITTMLLLLFSICSHAQENQTIEKLRLEFKIAETDLKMVQKSLESNNKLLEENKGYADLSNSLSDKTKELSNKRDQLLKTCEAIKKKMEDELKKESDKIESEISALENKEPNNKNLTDEHASETKEKKLSIKNLKKKAEKIQGQIKDISSVIESYNSTNVLSKNTNGEMARYMLMSGFNFELNSIDKLKYVGHFNIYVPVKETTQWGINTGLLKVNYKNNDGDNSFYKTDYVKVNPLDEIGIGSSYYGQYNKYSTKIDITSYSAYFQVLRKLFKKNNTAISAHFHTELLSTTFTTTATITEIQKDEIKITNQEQLDDYNGSGISLLDYLEKEKVQKDNLLQGYFGIGPTLDLGLLDNCTLFFQGTAGVAIQHNSSHRSNGLTRAGNLVESPVISKPKTFYLVRCYFQYYTSKSSQLVVGTDIRGLLPNQSPFYTIYAGVNLGIDKIADLFKDKK